jgi:hypothetical protein
MKHPAPPIGTLQPDRLLRLEAGLDVTASSTNAKKTRATKTRSSKLRIACWCAGSATHSNNHRNSTTQFGSPRAAFFFFLPVCSALLADRSSSRFPTGRRLLKLASPGEPVCVYIANPRTDSPRQRCHGSAGGAAISIAIPPNRLINPHPAKAAISVVAIRLVATTATTTKPPDGNSLHQQRHTHLPKAAKRVPNSGFG